MESGSTYPIPEPSITQVFGIRSCLLTFSKEIPPCVRPDSCEELDLSAFSSVHMLCGRVAKNSKKQDLISEMGVEYTNEALPSKPKDLNPRLLD